MLLLLIGWSSTLAKPRQSRVQVESHTVIRRFAVVVGTNDGGMGRVKLRYAQSDAIGFAQVMTELGGVRKADQIILPDPKRNDFLKAMQQMEQRILETTKANESVELLVYYSGHSDENGLLLGEEKISYVEFRSLIDAIPAKIRLAVVDACASGSLTRLKGGNHIPAFTVDQSSNLSGYAFITSSSGHESSQESDRIRASFFTHYLLTGLRGAADLNQDGKVTLSEAYEFAFHETLNQTEGTQAGAQHPGYDMRLTGTGDLVLTDLRGTSAGLVLSPELNGRLFLRSAAGNLVAEVQKRVGKKMELGLEPGIYEMQLDQGEKYFRGLIQIDSSSHRPVTLNDFEPTLRENTRQRGDTLSQTKDSSESDSTRNEGLVSKSLTSPSSHEWIPVRIAIIPPLGFPGWVGGPYSHLFSFNLLGGNAKTIQGLQISGLVNVADTTKGVQLAPVNISKKASGVQIGAVNVATEFEGLQIGVINITSKSHGAVLGPLNFIGNGIHDIQGVIDEKGILHSELVLGGPYNYFFYSFDSPGIGRQNLWGYSGGLGAQFSYSRVFANLDLGSGVLHDDRDWANYSVTSRIRLHAGYHFLRYLSFFGGVSNNLEMWPGSQFSNLNPSQVGTEWGADIRSYRWTGFFAGFRL